MKMETKLLYIICRLLVILIRHFVGPWRYNYASDLRDIEAKLDFLEAGE